MGLFAFDFDASEAGCNLNHLIKQLKFLNDLNRSNNFESYRADKYVGTL